MSAPAHVVKGGTEEEDAGEPEISTNVKLAAALRAEHEGKFMKLARLQEQVVSKQTPSGQVPDEIPDCAFCKAKKHEVKWICRRGAKRDGKRIRIVTGSCCFCCYRASILLGPCSRSPPLVDAAGLREIFLRMSANVRRNAGDDDVCSCYLYV